jgi:hypothetical protein
MSKPMHLARGVDKAKGILELRSVALRNGEGDEEGVVWPDRALRVFVKG